MGVLYLHTFSKMIGAFKKVNLIEEIRQYWSTTQTEPIIVIDGINLMYSIIRAQRLPWLASGHLLLFEKYLKFFIHKLRKELVKIVVIFDGANWMYNRDTWTKRRKEGIAEYHKIFDKLDQYDTVEEIETCCENHVRLDPGLHRIAMKVFIEEECQLIRAVYDCDYEIATYVNDHQCLGLIANDTDFLINCSCNIYTTFDLNIDTMHTLKRDRKRLVTFLSIDEKLLPLFASVVGNDVVSSNEESHIKSQYKNGYKVDIKNFFLDVATYLRHLNINDGISDTLLEKIACDIFNDPQKATLLRKSIESYNVYSVKFGDIMKKILFSYENKEWEIILKMIFNYCRYGGSSQIFAITAQNTFQCNELPEDYRKNDFPPINKIMKPLRKKIYGILLHEKPGKHFVEEMVVDNPDTFETVLVEATPPRVPHPGLVALWENINEDSKWALLGDAVDVEPSKFRSLPAHLIVPAVASRYIRECAVLDKWELRCLILSAVIVSYMQEPFLSSISLRRIKSRALTVFALYNRACCLICVLIEALGNIVPLHKTVATYYCDGNVFHLIYNAMKEGINPLKILNLGFKKFFESKFTACEATLEHIMNFVFED